MGSAWLMRSAGAAPWRTIPNPHPHPHLSPFTLTLTLALTLTRCGAVAECNGFSLVAAAEGELGQVVVVVEVVVLETL